MPQIDTVAYIPIIFWTLIIILSGYLLLNMYFLLELSGIIKLPRHYRQNSVIEYWDSWNDEEDIDYSYWTAYAILLATTYTLDHDEASNDNIKI